MMKQATISSCAPVPSLPFPPLPFPPFPSPPFPSAPRSATNRNAHVPKSKPLEADEASHQLASVRAQFSHVTIDYGFQINTVACVKGYEILDKVGGALTGRVGGAAEGDGRSF